MPKESGHAFNIGGGPAHSVSLLELLDLIAELTDRPPLVEFDEWRLGDQRYYVSDTSRFRRATGWRPTVPVREGVARLAGWLRTAARPPAPAEHLAGGRR
jgi:CDP-paratose 2-epimerase